jgi:cytochrome P450
VAPLFHRQRVAGYAETFARLADERATRWADGERLDVHAEMGELTLAIVARAVFDADLASDVVATIRRAVTTTSRVSLLAAFPRAMAVEGMLPSSATRRAWQARDDLYAVVARLIDDRRRAGAGGDDLLSLLLTARDADTGDRLDDEAVRAEALTILLAGHETTANALSWAYHLISGCSRAAAAMHAELDAELGDRLPSAEDLPRLPYTRAVFTESLRLYPPVWMLIRRSLHECTLGGVHIPADSTLVISQWVVHRDPEIWPQPAEFRPERWLGEQPADIDPAARTVQTAQTDEDGHRHRFGFFPFGGGPRQCVGNTFAEMEGTMILATLGRRWAFEAVPGTRVQPLPRVVLRPKGGLPMTARRR